MEIEVRRARLSDAEAIAAFVNAAQPASSSEITREDVAGRFGQVGFMVAERDGQLRGVMGWQIENLVVRITDFLIAAGADPLAMGRVLITKMEAEAKELQAEAVLLFMPQSPSVRLVAFWEDFGYEFRPLKKLPKAWREAVVEGDGSTQSVMVKRLRQDVVWRPV
ncbi:MAG: hypothetical protein ACP5HG_04790 [Anaerolineae bacterium]